MDPVDTYTSVFYTIVAYLMYRMAKGQPKVIRNIAWIPFAVTFGSILFHASFTYTFLIADFLGIFYLNFYGINLNLVRLGRLEESKVAGHALWTTLGYGFLMAVMYKIHLHTGLLMIPILGVFMWTEYKSWKIEPDTRYKYYWLAILFSGVGYIFMLIENPPFRFGCVPGPLYGKLQLHTVWHFMSATSMICIFKFYNQKSITKKLKFL